MSQGAKQLRIFLLDRTGAVIGRIHELLDAQTGDKGELDKASNQALARVAARLKPPSKTSGASAGEGDDALWEWLVCEVPNAMNIFNPGAIKRSEVHSLHAVVVEKSG
jgi:hypothetical protein